MKPQRKHLFTCAFVVFISEPDIFWSSCQFLYWWFIPFQPVNAQASIKQPFKGWLFKVCGHCIGTRTWKNISDLNNKIKTLKKQEAELVLPPPCSLHLSGLEIIYKVVKSVPSHPNNTDPTFLSSTCSNAPLSPPWCTVKRPWSVCASSTPGGNSKWAWTQSHTRTHAHTSF